MGATWGLTLSISLVISQIIILLKGLGKKIDMMERVCGLTLIFQPERWWEIYKENFPFLSHELRENLQFLPSQVPQVLDSFAKMGHCVLRELQSGGERYLKVGEIFSP